MKNDLSPSTYTKEDVTGSPLCTCSNLRAQKMCFIRDRIKKICSFMFEVFLSVVKTNLNGFVTRVIKNV